MIEILNRRFPTMNCFFKISNRRVVFGGIKKILKLVSIRGSIRLSVCHIYTTIIRCNKGGFLNSRTTLCFSNKIISHITSNGSLRHLCRRVIKIVASFISIKRNAEIFIMQFFCNSGDSILDTLFKVCGVNVYDTNISMKLWNDCLITTKMKFVFIRCMSSFGTLPSSVFSSFSGLVDRAYYAYEQEYSECNNPPSFIPRFTIRHVFYQYPFIDKVSRFYHRTGVNAI